MSSLVNYDLFTSRLGIGNCGFTLEGGFYEKFINNTGLSVKGTIVVISTTISNGVDIAEANSKSAIGVIYESGIPNGSAIKVVVYGKAQVLLKDGESSNNGYCYGTSDVPGRMYKINIVEQNLDFGKQIGYSLEEKSSGTDTLALVHLNFK